MNEADEHERREKGNAVFVFLLKKKGLVCYKATC